MEKINIISEHMIVKISTFGQVLIVIGFFLISIGLFVFFNIARKDWGHRAERIGCPIISMGALLCLVSMSGQYYSIPYVSTDTGRKEYKCTIKEDIPFNEITKMYDIVEYDNENNIWTLEDKERKNK